MGKIKPILTLVIFATVIPELLSGSTPLRSFFNPGYFLFLAILGYGVPVLLIREFAVRKNISLGGVVALGMAYGIYNEGLIAKTLLLVTNVPIPTYDNYGIIFGIGVPWMLAIGLWHSVASVLFPILFTHALCPDSKNELWLNKKFTAIGAVVILVLVSRNFLEDTKVMATLEQLGIFLALMTLWVFLALRFRAPAEGTVSSFSTRPLWLGVSTFFFFFVALSMMAAQKVPVVIFFLVLGLGVWGYHRILKNNGWWNSMHLVLFGIGCYIQSALLGMALRLGSGNMVPDALIMGVGAVVILLWFTKVIKHCFVEKVAGGSEKGPGPFSG